MPTLWLTAYLAVLVSPVVPRPEQPDLKELGAIAGRIKLPLPPKDARLVLAAYPWPDPRFRPVSTELPYYTPAFLLEEKADGSVVVLRGLDRDTVTRGPKGEPPWREFSPDRGDPKVDRYRVMWNLSSFLCAVQLAARGEMDTAKQVLDRFSEDGWFEHETLPEVYRVPRLMLAQLLSEDLWDRITQKPMSWPDTLDRIKALFAEYPEMLNDEWRGLMADLTTTLKAKPPARGSVEALLLDWSVRPDAGVPAFHVLMGAGGLTGPNAPAREIVLRGFDAVPDLIALLDDQRVTAHMSPSFNRIPASIRRVGDLAWTVLEEMTAWQVRPTAEDEPLTVTWRAWWEKARVQGERDYFTSIVFKLKDGRIIDVAAAPAHILARKHPGVMAELCERFSDQAAPEMSSHYLAAAVAAAKLSKADRVKLLAALAGRGTAHHRIGALAALGKIDEPACVAILIPLLDKVARDTDGRYWCCPEAGLTHVVMGLQSDAVWRAHLRAVKRAGVGLRMEMLAPLSNLYIETPTRARRLTTLAAFLDDEAVRDTATDPEKFESAAAARFPRIAVRDFAAMQIGCILGLPETPDPAWDDERWVEYRRLVREKLAGEKLPALDQPNGKK